MKNMILTMLLLCGVAQAGFLGPNKSYYGGSESGSGDISIQEDLDMNGYSILDALNVDAESLTCPMIGITADTDLIQLAIDEVTVNGGLIATGTGEVNILEIVRDLNDGGAWRITPETIDNAIEFRPWVGGSYISGHVFQIDSLGNIVINDAGFQGGGTITTNAKSNSGSGILNIFNAGLELGAGSGTAGDGLSYLFRVENGGGVLHDAGKFVYEWSDPTAGLERSKFTVNTMFDGAFVAPLVVDGCVTFVGDGGTTNYTEISATGDIEPHGSATYKANGGNPGLSNTYTFGGGGSGDIATMTFEDGLLTSVTTVP